MDVNAEALSSPPSPMVDEVSSGCESEKSGKDRLIELLDQVEMHVERLRKEALKLEEERDTLFTTLDSVRNSDVLSSLVESDREDILRYADRITSRCLTIEVSVKTCRDRIQEEALFQVNKLINSLVISLKDDPSGTRAKCMSYMAACSSNYQGAIDKTFETAILGCTLDDQKRIHKRLQGLLDYMNQSKIMVAEG